MVWPKSLTSCPRLSATDRARSIQKVRQWYFTVLNLLKRFYASYRNQFCINCWRFPQNGRIRSQSDNHPILRPPSRFPATCSSHRIRALSGRGSTDSAVWTREGNEHGRLCCEFVWAVASQSASTRRCVFSFFFDPFKSRTCCMIAFRIFGKTRECCLHEWAPTAGGSSRPERHRESGRCSGTPTRQESELAISKRQLQCTFMPLVFCTSFICVIPYYRLLWNKSMPSTTLDSFNIRTETTVVPPTTSTTSVSFQPIKI